jgi:hypothetical protein
MTDGIHRPATRTGRHLLPRRCCHVDPPAVGPAADRVLAPRSSGLAPLLSRVAAQPPVPATGGSQ